MTPGAELTRRRELEGRRIGTVVMANSSPLPRYFVRVRGGWQACDLWGDPWVNAELVKDLDGWPEVLDSGEIRLPAIVVALVVLDERSAA